MEPCLFRHGKSTPQPGSRPSSRLQWSHVFSDMVRDLPNSGRFCIDDATSMEPCLFRHGKNEWVCGFDFAETLQWSHVFSDMVSAGRPERRQPPARTSMEPCLFRHGKPVFASTLRDLRRVTSMEPCLFRHGKRPPRRWSASTSRDFNGAMSFQTW